MTKKRKKKDERPVFDSIRKPVAPPTRRIGTGERPEEKIHPAGRTIKHKKQDDADI